MKGHFYKPHCKCPGKKTKKCSCGASWSYIIDVGINPQTGKRKQKKKGGFQTKGDAEKAAALLISELSQGTYLEESRLTFKEFTDKWLEYYASKHKDSSYIARRTSVRKLNKFLGMYKLKDITHDIYQDTLQQILYAPSFGRDHVAHGSMVQIHATSRMIFKWAMEKSLIRNNPTDYAYLPKVEKSLEEIETEDVKDKYFEKEELSAFLEAAKKHGERSYVMFMILAYTGMRVGELCALKWKDIDFEEGIISINRNIFFAKDIKNYKLLTPKTKSSKREITVEKELIELLKLYKSNQNEFRMRYRDIYHDEDFVMGKGSEGLRDHYGYPEKGYHVRQRMQRVLKMTGINKKLTPHSLRHTHTSLLAEAGASLDEIMERLGHSNDTTTRTIYLHITKIRKRDASQKFHSLMKNVEPLNPDVTQMLPLDIKASRKH